MTLDDDVARLGRTRPFDLLPREAVQLDRLFVRKTAVEDGRRCFARARPPTPAISSIRARSRCSRTERNRKASDASARAPSSARPRSTLPIARRVSARAAEDAVVMRIPRETFRRVLEEFPAAAKKIRAALAARTRLGRRAGGGPSQIVRTAPSRPDLGPRGDRRDAERPWLVARADVGKYRRARPRRVRPAARFVSASKRGSGHSGRRLPGRRDARRDGRRERVRPARASFAAGASPSAARSRRPANCPT